MIQSKRVVILTQCYYANHLSSIAQHNRLSRSINRCKHFHSWVWGDLICDSGLSISNGVECVTRRARARVQPQAAARREQGRRCLLNFRHDSHLSPSPAHRQRRTRGHANNSGPPLRALTADIVPLRPTARPSRLEIRSLIDTLLHYMQSLVVTQPLYLQLSRSPFIFLSYTFPS